MKALVLTEIGKILLKETPDPVLKAESDAIVRVTTAGICGSDLHIIHGRDAGVRLGTIMGHEMIGIVESVGREVQGLQPGDRVVAPFTVNCGECFYCIRDLPARCVQSEGFGFVTEDGKGLEGAQAEMVRVPLASSTLMKMPAHRPDGSELPDEDALFLGDILSTAYSCAEKGEIRKKDVVVVVGCGPVGLLSVVAARMFEPSEILAVDFAQYRLDMAKSLGATAVCAPDFRSMMQLVRNWTDGRGADAVLEAVGRPEALDLAIEMARPGAIVSIAGYHTLDTYPFPIQKAYTKNLTLKIGRCNARKYMTQLLPRVLNRDLSTASIITHVLPLSDGVKGYEIFDGHLDSAIKVLLKP